jgi:hypothetical protein
MKSDRWRLAPLLALAWPVVFFGDRVFPFRGTITATGNDFISLYWVYKAYLLDCLARWSLPLWSPSEAAGYPFYSSPFTQTFYPLNLPLAVFHALAGGYSPHDHQVFTAVGNGLFALGAFLWLRSLGIGAAGALFAACVVSTSFRFGDLLRLPNAVHTALWYPWILLAFDRILGARGRGELARWGTALCGFLVAFLTAGYPYYVYYSLFLFPPYLLLAAFGWLDGVARAPLRRLGVIAGAGAFALVLCAPYLAKVKQTLDATVGRTAGVHHPWYEFGPIDSLNSLVFPVGASPEGCYYFGVAGLLLLVLYAVELARDPAARGERRLCAALIGWCLAVSYLSWGQGTLLFPVLERALPGFARLRVWARLSIVLLPLLAWLLARAFERFQSRLAAPVTEARDPRRDGAKVLLGALVVIAAVQGAQVLSGSVHRYYDVYLAALRGFAAWSLLGSAMGFLALGGLLLAAGRRRPPGVSPAATVAVLLAASAADVWPVGARMWATRTPSPERVPFDVAAVVRRAPEVPRRVSYSTVTLVDPARPERGFSPAFNVGLVPDWYFRRYADFLVGRDPAELEYFLGGVNGRRLFLSARVDHAGVRAFLEDCVAFGGAFAIAEYTGDRLEAEVTMPADGFVTFVDNWDPDWRAFVDGTPAPIVTAFGTFKAAAVPAGRHRVLFKYAPRLWP